MLPNLEQLLCCECVYDVLFIMMMMIKSDYLLDDCEYFLCWQLTRFWNSYSIVTALNIYDNDILFIINYYYYY